MRSPWRRWALAALIALIILGAATIGVYASYRSGSTGG